MAQPSNKTSRTWQEYGAWVSKFFVASRGHKWIRNIIITFFLIAFIWLTYSRVYNPLKEDVPLPVSISKDNPSLNLKILQAINTQRAERIKRDKPDYFNFSQVFVAPKANE